MSTLSRLALLALALCLAPGQSLAAPAPGEQPTTRDAPLGDATRDAPSGSVKGEPAGRPLGLSLELGLATGYLFRGANVFRPGSQMDSTLMIQPEVDWAIGRSGITVGYWGAYQLTGDDVDTNVEEGLGAEQGLYVHYERELVGALTGALWLSWYFYPAATEEAAGVAFPCYLEPGAGLRLQTVIGLGLDVSFLAGLQSALSPYSYLYLNPYADHTFELTDTLWLELKLSLGYKLLAEEPSSVTDNMFDVTTRATLIWVITSHVYTKAVLGLTWTNLGEREETDSDGKPVTVDPGFSDEVGLLGKIGLGVEF